MPEGLLRSLRGKWWAARSLGQLFRYFENWPEIWRAYRACAPLPPLRFRDGIILEHGPGDDPICLFREIFVDRCYTPSDFYRPSPGDCVMDLGANIGTFALFLQRAAPGIRVHCFEPGREARRRLERNIALNGRQGVVRVHPYAVSDRRKTLELRVGKLLAQHSFYGSEFSDPSGALEAVECLSLGEALASCGAPIVDLLKIDAEGAEIEIVEGADAAVWPRIRRVSLEYHDRIRPGCRARVEKALARRGFDDVRPGLASPLEGFGILHARRRAP